MMDYSKYYTPSGISDILINMAEIDNPSNIIDICCGSCNLLHSAKKKWGSAILNGVDLLPHKRIENVNYLQQDGRFYALKCKRKFDLVLANPPFGYNNNRYIDLYQGIFSDYITHRLENEMLIANLKILNEGGTLIIILPSTFVEGQTNIKIRSIIANNYFIEKIVKLPNETFGIPNIKSYALIIKKIKSKKYTQLYYINIENNQYNTSQYEIIDQGIIESGYWLANVKKKNILLYARGKISSADFSENGIQVLHIQKKQNNWEPAIRYVKDYKNKEVYVNNRDILISRIGKSAGCWKKYYGKRMLISDCLIKIEDSGDVVFGKIKDKDITHLVKGVVVRYIAISDIEVWYSSL